MQSPESWKVGQLPLVRVGSYQLESCFAEKYLQVLVDIKLNMSQQPLQKGRMVCWKSIWYARKSTGANLGR